MQDKERSTRSGTGAHRSLLKYREGCDSSWSWGCLRKKELISPTYRTCILARPQKAPSVSLLMLLRCSFRTSKLSSPWNVSPSIRRMRFRFSSLKSPRPNMFIKPQPFLTKSSVQHTMGTAMPTAPLSVVPRGQQRSTGNFQSQSYPGKAAGCDRLNKLTPGQAFTTEK